MKATVKGDKNNIQLVISLDNSYDDTTKAQIAQAAIDTIIDRTADNKDYKGKGFTAYKKSYYDSDEFDRWGKSKNDINMDLTGSMLSDMDIISIGEDEIVLGFGSTINQKKAANHNRGETVPKREFFNLSDSELMNIEDEFSDSTMPKEFTDAGVTTSTLGELLDQQSATALQTNTAIRQTLGDFLDFELEGF